MSRKDRPEPPDVPDPDAPPTEAELAAAAELRRMLDGALPKPGNADWELVEAVRRASRPTPIAEETHGRIVDTALRKSTKGKVVTLAFGVLAGAAAMAAALALIVRGRQELPGSGMPAPATMAVSRSAADLFPDGFPTTGGTSDRVDRIAYARARDLRENRFATWGVR